MKKLYSTEIKISYDEYVDLIRDGHHFWTYEDLANEFTNNLFIFDRTIRPLMTKNNIEFSPYYLVCDMDTENYNLKRFFIQGPDYDNFVEKLKILLANERNTF
jgi:hypothetical protein